MVISALDEVRLGEALALAQNSIGLSDPNPRVGCVIGTTDGAVLGTGFTQCPGGAHAEIMAFRDATSRGLDVRGATAWVTLEPCAHHGRTPPCCDAIINAGISRVVVASADPFPAVNGEGIQRLRCAGIEVDLAQNGIASAARELNIGFFSRVERGRPWVRIKLAMSLDGKSALANGHSKWITSAEARADGHSWRKRASVIVTGIGTVLADDPALDVREVSTARQPQRAVIDTMARLPCNAKILRDAASCIVFTSDEAETEVLRAVGVEVDVVARSEQGLNLAAVIERLGRRECNEVHVEAGPTLTSQFVQLGLADELLVYVAPRLFGGGRAAIALPELSALSDALDFKFIDCRHVGPDLRLLLRPAVEA